MAVNFQQKVEEIVRQDLRYKADAYEFLMQALMFTQKGLKKQGHVSGRELSEGARDFALEQYGPMARVVLGHWGIKSTQGLGDIVFNMIENGLLGKTEEDSRADFKDVYDFEEAFDVFKAKRLSK
jgi:uncharacterized repeat protein (TIGR04138 family)